MEEGGAGSFYDYDAPLTIWPQYLEENTAAINSGQISTGTGGDAPEDIVEFKYE